MKRIEILMNKLNDFHKILGGEETGCNYINAYINLFIIN